jgi:hypothetical protein
MELGNWAQALAIIGSNIALIIVMFGSTIAIWLHTDKKIDEIQKEMKDFHGRLAGLEVKNKMRSDP